MFASNKDVGLASNFAPLKMKVIGGVKFMGTNSTIDVTAI